MIIAVSLGGLLWLLQSLPLSLVTLDCAELRELPGGDKARPPLCEFTPGRSLRLFADADDQTAFRLFSGRHDIPVEKHSVEGGVLLEFKVPEQGGTLWLLARRGLHLTIRRIEVRAKVEPAWLRDAYALWQDNKADKAAQLLTSQTEASLATADQARRDFVLARIAIEQDRISDGERFAERALAKSREAGLIILELDVTALLARLYNERFHQVGRAEQLWRERGALLEKMPEMRPWELLSLAIYRQEVWDLDGALERIEQGERWSRRFADIKVAVELAIQRATIYHRMGRLAEGDRILEQLPLGKLSPCRRAFAQEAIGRLRLMSSAVATGAKSATQRRMAQTILSSALQTTEQKCDQVNLRAALWTRLGQVAAGDGDYAAGAAYAKKARDIVTKPQPLLELDWLELEGRRALHDKLFTDSKKIYERMLSAAQRLDADEAIWQALQGLAQTTEADDKAGALTFYQQAESFLDERSLMLPLGNGRGGFLGRFELGTRRLIDLLHDEGRFDEAFAVSRHARLRGLRTLTLLSRIDRLDAQRRTSFEQALARYHEQRAILTRVISEEADASLINLAALKQRHQAQSERVLAAMAAAMKTLGENREVETFRTLEKGEVLLLCHPAVLTWRCYLSSAAGVTGKKIDLDVDAELEKIPFEELSNKILSPFAAQLREASRVSIAAYGRLRQLDFHRLPFDGARLDGGPDGQRQVVYSLDLEGQQPSSPVVAPRPGDGNARALLLIDRELNLPHIRKAGTPIIETLSRAGWQLKSAIGDTRGRGTWPGEPPAAPDAPLTREETLASLPKARLFVYAGHAIFAGAGGWQHELRTSPHAGLFIGDILTLPQAPEGVTLFACNSAQSAEETGGLEGLGLAQAFLLRGSRFALGTVRKVDDKLASVVAGAFFRALAAGEASPVRALRSAVAEAQQSQQITEAHTLAEITPTNDLGAFRIFTAR